MRKYKKGTVLQIQGRSTAELRAIEAETTWADSEKMYRSLSIDEHTTLCYGMYMLVTHSSQSTLEVVTSLGYRLCFDDKSLIQYNVVGEINICKPESLGRDGRRVRGVECRGPTGVRRAVLCVRKDYNDCETTRIGDLRLYAFYKLFSEGYKPDLALLELEGETNYEKV